MTKHYLVGILSRSIFEENMIIEHQCGNCTACCKTHPVMELDKPARTWCPECEIGKSCKIYGRHPKGCREFECLWLQRYLAPEHRPDLVGIVLDCVWVEVIGSVIIIFEVTEGAILNDIAQKYTRTYLETGFPVCHYVLQGPNILYLPRHFIIPKNMSFVLDDNEVTLVRV